MEQINKNYEDGSIEQEQIQDTARLELTNEATLDLKGGRILQVPDLVELSNMGFSEDQLKRVLRLRHVYETSDSELLNQRKTEDETGSNQVEFLRWLYEHGRLNS